VRASFFALDPELGCAVKEVGGGVFVVSDNMWQSAFLVTDSGVVVFDVPESFGNSIQSVVARVTDKPIKTLIYSHIHRDHIGGLLCV
jgi:alkyl sulfatase BDS1-like metallo-beta-lactamase superfamily hydrolase